MKKKKKCIHNWVKTGWTRTTDVLVYEHYKCKECGYKKSKPIVEYL